MRNFKNNLRKNKFRNGSDRGFTRNSSTKLNGDFVNNDNFRRKNPGKNNHNASKLIEKYNDLAREALSKGDKILSENYFQHADHFTRVLSEREIQKKQLDNKPYKNSEQSLSESNNKDTENFSQDNNQVDDKIETKVS